jgi:hypothetical protein
MKVNLTTADIRAIETVLEMAEANACSCDCSEEDRGYLGHAKDCWVYLYRAHLKRVKAIAQRATPTTPARAGH